MGTDEVCHAQLTAFTEGSSGCFFKKKKKKGQFFFFKKKEITKHLPSGKINKSKKGAKKKKKPTSSKLKDGYAKKNKYIKSVRGQTFF